MEMSNFRPESHVAQQMRRDKLRIQQVYNMEQLSVHNVHNNNANLLYDPALVTSEMLNYSANSSTLFPHRDQESGAEYDSACANLPHPVFSHYNTKVTRDVQNSGVWRSIGSTSNNRVMGSQSNGQNCVMGDEDPTTIGTTSKAYGNYNTTGPLGPFTGYATILKSSKYLTPAQMLLDQTCKTDIISGDGISAIPDSSAFYGSDEMSGEFGGGMSSSESHRPDFQQKKAKLMFMHEEICRRYKQYHQQIQMVVSSFETVAGLSGSTPYISFALKTVTKHFRHLKNAISNHLSDTDLSSPTAGTTSSGKLSEHNKLKFAEQAGGYFHKHKSNGDQGNIIGLLDPHQQQVWRPQRGLPDRAVSVLRAWLFDHFLHPYPTDTDKHMLANQTGLTRNQVSNWFINARVRIWKPMVEEIHMLETQGLAETNHNPSKNDGLAFTGNANHPKNDQQWSQDKRSRIDDNIPVGVTLDGGSFMGSVPPYHRNALEYGGLGSVSLTLGLRQNVESAAQQQQLLQRERQVMQHFGGHMVHDFVG